MSALIGILLAVASVQGARAFGLERARAVYPVLLIVIVSFYALFALMSGDPVIVAREVLLALPFLVVVGLGLRVSLWWVVGGIAAHGVLDAVHGQVITNGGVPSWWPAFCAAYDIAAAVMLGATLRRPNLRSLTVAARSSMSKPIGMALLAASCLTASTALAQAQDISSSQARVGARSAVSLAFIQTRPVGDMAHNAGIGYGVAGALLVPLSHSGVLSLRADLGVSAYGEEVRRTAFSETVGGRAEVNVRTTNTLVPGSVGLQLAAIAGAVRPYVTAGMGVLAFYTESTVEPTNGDYILAATVNQSDVALAWTVGGGFYVPIRVGTLSALLDVSGQYTQGGRAQYLTPGSIIDLPGGRIRVTPQESSTHMIALRLGARIGV